MYPHPSTGLVELLATEGRNPPEDLDIITEAGGEADGWMVDPRPGDLDIITRSVECDRWSLEDPRPGDLDILTRDRGETDAWSRLTADPQPRPDDLDILTLDDSERCLW
ncbi:MAG: hypothetical protein QOK16_3634 [Solirubrobacteraceae bacterium]|jgi:hypothetical protein|nr:hypothetical protein [Solirubrobacteraceae bacterium]